MSYRTVLLILVVCDPLTTLGQVNSERYRDLFLVGEFGEVNQIRAIDSSIALI
jgi:hypothetical protein